MFAPTDYIFTILCQTATIQSLQREDVDDDILIHAQRKLGLKDSRGRGVYCRRQ
jgi:hypothetical protein